MRSIPTISQMIALAIFDEDNYWGDSESSLCESKELDSPSANTLMILLEHVIPSHKKRRKKLNNSHLSDSSYRPVDDSSGYDVS